MTRRERSASPAGSRADRARSTSARTRSARRTLAGVGPHSSRKADQVSSSTATRATRAPTGREPLARRRSGDAGGAADRGFRLRVRLAMSCSATVYALASASVCPVLAVDGVGTSRRPRSDAPAGRDADTGLGAVGLRRSGANTVEGVAGRPPWSAIRGQPDRASAGTRPPVRDGSRMPPWCHQ